MSDNYITQIAIDGVSYDIKDTSVTEGFEKRPEQLCFTNIEVAVADWEASQEITGYSYCAEIATVGTTANHSPDIRFNAADALSGIFAPVADCDEDVTYIYANAVPSAAITIPAILCTRMSTVNI